MDYSWHKVEQTLPKVDIPRSEYGVSWNESLLVEIYYDTNTDAGRSYGIARYTTDGWVGISYDGLTDLSQYDVLAWRYLETIYWGE